MRIPLKEKVIFGLQEHIGAKLYRQSGKRVFYNGKRVDCGKIVVCTPQSKLHRKGHGWIDFTRIQFLILDEADDSILAFRMEGDKVYYFYFRDFKDYLTKDSMLYNKREGDHWKLYIWPNYIEVRGNSTHFQIVPNNLKNL
jgi:hypothetical protein